MRTFGQFLAEHKALDKFCTDYTIQETSETGYKYHVSLEQMLDSTYNHTSPALAWHQTKNVDLYAKIQVAYAYNLRNNNT